MRSGRPTAGGRRRGAARRRATHLLAACSIVVSCGLPFTAPVSASPLTSGFAIADGRAATNDLQVTVGDGGDSPFFARGVLVWEGGSIIAGVGATHGAELTRQTHALMSHTCRSFKSTSNSRRVADMIAQAPANVDTRYDADADADICIVMAGGGDFAAGADPAIVFGGLQTYCAARRAAGFKVVVLTLLPRDLPAFNAARNLYNADLRVHWASFADGLADVAADPRIGADGANHDPVYFSDGLHPSSAGYAVMAAAVAPVLEGIGWHSATCTMRVSDALTPWTAWYGYLERTSWLLPAGDGPKTVTAQYRDGDGDVVAVSDDIMLDTVLPVTRATANVVVRRRATAVLSYRVDDARPGSKNAAVTIVIKRSTGRTALRLGCGKPTVNAPHTVEFRCALRKGAYRYYVTASDAAGNRQSRVGSARLIVR